MELARNTPGSAVLSAPQIAAYDNQSFSINGFLTFNWFFANQANDSIFNTHIPNGIEIGFGIHDTAI